MNSAFRRAVYLFEPPDKAAVAGMIGSSDKKGSQGRTTTEAEDIAAADQAAANKKSSDEDAFGQQQQIVLPLKAAVQHLQCIFTHLEHSQQSPYSPEHMVRALRMNPGEQQDVHEFLNLLVFNV